jgi:predicted DNA-binding transcriptional regulator AlpA
MAMEVNEIILNSKDLAKLLNISGNKLTRLMKERMPHVCLGGDDRKAFLKSSVLQWLKNREK